jgi:predicted nucleic acid-binding protein
MPGSFFDTNIVLYALSDDTAKAAVTAELLAAGGTISVQVLNELANVARRKMSLSWPETYSFLETVRGLLRVEHLTLGVHDTGLALAERYRLPIYDAMIAAAALHADCDTLLSEDFHHGQMLDDRVRVVNPYIAPA